MGEIKTDLSFRNIEPSHEFFPIAEVLYPDGSRGWNPSVVFEDEPVTVAVGYVPIEMLEFLGFDDTQLVESKFSTGKCWVALCFNETNELVGASVVPLSVQDRWHELAESTGSIVHDMNPFREFAVCEYFLSMGFVKNLTDSSLDCGVERI